MKLSERFLEELRPQEFDDIKIYGKICKKETEIEIVDQMIVGLKTSHFSKDFIEAYLRVLKKQKNILKKELKEIAKLNHL